MSVTFLTWMDTLDSEAVNAAADKLLAEHPAYVRDTAHGDAQFAVWLTMVDWLLAQYGGEWSHQDMPSVGMSWRERYDRGQSPATAVGDDTHYQWPADLRDLFV